ncbi:MAG: tetratricopeptide repeat protein [Bdellovibrionales bacterium]
MTALLQKAVDAHQSGNLAEAEKLYRDVLAKSPDQPDALALLGVILDSRGDAGRAIELIEKAIRLDPGAGLFKLHLGNALMTASRHAEAVTAFRQAAAQQPGMAQAHFNLGNALRKTGDWSGAVEAYREAIRCRPAYAEAFNNLALALVHENRFDEAMEKARASVVVAPQFGEAWLTLCNVAETVNDYPAALAAGEQVVRLMPDNHKAWFGYGVALNRLGRHEEALEAYKNALALKPDRADIWDNLGQTYQSLNRLDEAEAIFRKTVEVAGQAIPDEDVREVAEEEYGNRHWHLALIELLRGKYKQGFARYRARFKDIGELKRPRFPQPVWRGENLAGKTILICDEQGYGDTLMFCRYLPMLKQLGAGVVFSVHPVLEALFAGWPGADRVIVHGQPPGAIDFHASTFDLPHRFGTVMETIPSGTPYLPLPEVDAAARLEPAAGRKIAVVWGGSPLHKNDRNRSIPLELFSALFDAPDTQFYSLNRDLKPGDAELLPRLPVIDLAPRLRNFADAARFMRQCDRVITCDTATAHLAGGLGLPVWVLLPFAPDWRWLVGRDDSPWYPNMRLFRQGKAGEWRDVISRVKQMLAE